MNIHTPLSSILKKEILVIDCGPAVVRTITLGFVTMSLCLCGERVHFLQELQATEVFTCSNELAAVHI